MMNNIGVLKVGDLVTYLSYGVRKFARVARLTRTIVFLDNNRWVHRESIEGVKRGK
jgi:hypothetical protein